MCVAKVLFAMFCDLELILGQSFATQLNFRTFVIFAISVSHCIALFRKSCFASLANTSFARFRKYKFRSFTFVSQGFANTSFARFRKYKFRSFTFVSQGFARVSKIRVRKFSQKQFKQGFANSFRFAKFCKFRRVFAMRSLLKMLCRLVM